MPRAVALALTLLAAGLVACGGPGFSLAVSDFTIPADSTAGTVCWVEVRNNSAVAVRSAVFNAMATYRQGDPLIATEDTATIEVFGRLEPPSATCTSHAAGDMELGGPFALKVDERQTIRVGEGSAGPVLAQLANNGTFWLGARLVSGFQVGGEQTITFEGGTIQVWL